MRSFKALIPRTLLLSVTALISLLFTRSARAQPEPHRGGEANLVLPDLNTVEMLGMPGGELLLWGVLVCVLGLAFGVVTLKQVKDLPSHYSMTEISQLIWETCKTYLVNQGKFLLLLELFIGAIIVVYFGMLQDFETAKVLIILAFSLIGIGGSYGVAWYGIRINTYAIHAPRSPASEASRCPSTRSHSKRA